jgi:signal transduction histidine kinase
MSRRARWPRSVRARTTLVATGVVAVALGIAAIGLFWLISNRLVAAERASAVLRARDIAGLAEAAQLPTSLAFPGEATGVAQVVDRAGRVIASTSNLEGEPPIATTVLEPGQVRSDIIGGLPFAGDARFVVASAAATTPTGLVTVYTASSLETAEQTLAAIGIAMALGYPALLLVVALSASRAIGRALAPVEAIRAEVADIGEHGLDRRVPEPGSGDEIDRLAGTMNTMLARLEQSSSRQRRFVADASHELRSPVASLRTVLEVASAHPETATLRATVDDALADTHRLEVLVADLLTLARLDDAGAGLQLRPVDLVETCRTSIPATATVEVRRQPPREAWVTGDALVVRRAVTNLVENALRHARAKVQVTIERDDRCWVLRVDDDGDGIASEDRERVFERFVRLDDARSRDEGGSGLGLAIVAEIAEILGGEVEITDSPLGGARFSLALPAAEAPPKLGAAPSRNR